MTLNEKKKLTEGERIMAEVSCTILPSELICCLMNTGHDLVHTVMPIKCVCICFNNGRWTVILETIVLEVKNKDVE